LQEKVHRLNQQSIKDRKTMTDQHEQIELLKQNKNGDLEFLQNQHDERVQHYKQKIKKLQAEVQRLREG
jgi:hypothetical protein